MKPAVTVTRVEHVASLVAATGVTIAAALLMFAALGPTFVKASARPVADAPRDSVSLVYLIPRVPATAAVAGAQAAALPLAARTGSRTAVGLSVPEPGTAPLRDTASVARRNHAATADAASAKIAESVASPHSIAGAPATSAIVGFTRPSQPIRFDSALRAVSDSLSARLLSGRLVPPPPTQAKLDEKWRAEAFEVVAARGAGTPVRTPMVGRSISVPLPFGGPSRKQRERDRAIYTQSMMIRALRQPRIDSVVTARQRRADSLARLQDSLRPRPRPPL